MIYIRVSTDEQAERGYSQRDQEERLRTYCQINDIEIKAAFKEDHSAKDFNRPEFKKLMQFARDNKRDIDLLLFTKWDRFSRNATHAYEKLSAFDSLGVIVQAIEQPLDLDVPENKLMLAFYLAAPEVENDRRGINIKQGMRRKRKEGRWDCTAPKGYVNKRDENYIPIVVPNDDAKYIREAFEEIAKGLKPYDNIRRELNKKGFVCSKSYFAKIIRNPFYMGKVKIGAYKGEPEEIVDGIHEPLVSESLFYQVQAILDGRTKKRNSPKIHRDREELPMRGFMYCPECNRKLTGSASKGNGGKYFYYHCQSCGKVRIRADEVNKQILKVLRSYKIKPEFKELFYKVYQDYVLGNERDRFKQNKEIQQKMEKLHTRISNLQDRLADGEISGVDYSEMKGRYDGQLTDLKLDKAEARVYDEDLKCMMQRALYNMENVDKIFLHAGIEDKKMFIGSIFTDKVYFVDGRVRTTAINEVVKVVSRNKRAFQGIEIGQPLNYKQLSFRVNPRRLEPELRSLAEIVHKTIVK